MHVRCLYSINTQCAFIHWFKGKTNEGGSQTAEELKSPAGLNMALYVIGVGADIDYEELRNLASQPYSKHLFLLGDYDTVEALAFAITNQEEGTKEDILCQ
mgnify:CR=1 FL=1